jgi:hypothetical protein
MKMAGEPFGFAAFRSRQQTQAFESALKKQGIACKTINTPHEIGMGCGLSVKFSMKDLSAAITISERKSFTALIGFYSAEYVNGAIAFKPVTRAMRYGN